MAPPSKRQTEGSRILFVKNLPYKATGEDLYKIFGRYGRIRQIRLGNAKETKGSAFVVYHEVSEAKAALEALSGFNVENRYLTILYFHPSRKRTIDLQAKREEVEQLRKQYEMAKQAAQQRLQ